MYLTNAKAIRKRFYNLPMSRFSGGTRGGITVAVKPVDFRRCTLYGFWTFPYFAGTPVPFEIKIVNGDAELHNLPLNYIAPSGELAYRPFHDTHITKGTVTELVVPSSGSLEVWLGEANRPQSVLLVHADPVNPTVFFVGGIGTLIGLLLARLLSY